LRRTLYGTDWGIDASKEGGCDERGSSATAPRDSTPARRTAGIRGVVQGVFAARPRPSSRPTWVAALVGPGERTWRQRLAGKRLGLAWFSPACLLDAPLILHPIVWSLWCWSSISSSSCSYPTQGICALHSFDALFCSGPGTSM
jgi:hypothetical protein